MIHYIKVASMVDKPCRTTHTVISPNRWHFSGKESQSILNASIPLLDFGARMYNPAIARWTAADPLSEKYHGISPYVYCMRTPVNLIDCLGKKVIPYGSALCRLFGYKQFLR